MSATLQMTLTLCSDSTLVLHWLICWKIRFWTQHSGASFSSLHSHKKGNFSFSAMKRTAVSCQTTNKVIGVTSTQLHVPVPLAVCFGRLNRGWWAPEAKRRGWHTLLEPGRVDRGQKPVQHISKVYSGFSCQEFRGTVVLGINNFKIKKHLDTRIQI